MAVKMGVPKMRMLRWMCGVTKMDGIMNEGIRTTKVGERSKKMQERRLLVLAEAFTR